MFNTAEDFAQYPFLIPNRDQETNLDDFIDAEERAALYRFLGRPFAKKFIDAFDDQANNPLAERWVKLIAGTGEGEVYDTGTREYIWVGMKKALQGFVHAKWLMGPGNAANVSGNGIIEVENENSIQVSPSQAISDSWNKYSDYVGDDCYIKNTLYGFLYFNGALYNADVVRYGTMQNYLSEEFKGQGRLNRFGIRMS